MNPLVFRLADSSDVRSLMWLYQKAARNVNEEPLCNDARKLTEALQSSQFLLFVGERDGQIQVSLSFLVDLEHRFAKLNRLYIDPEAGGNNSAGDNSNSNEAFDGSFSFAKNYLSSNSIVDIIYTTTRTLTLEQQAKTLDHGFVILGIFPSGPGIDTLKLNGMTAYYPEGVLNSRQGGFTLHPAIVPYFKIAQRQLKLPDLREAEVKETAADSYEPLPSLEWIEAPLFVKRRFQDLKERRFLTNHFYPFQEPNVLITDPTQSAEIFLKVSPGDHFATIIGERINLRLDPVKLYESILSILTRRSYSYIEIVNDAADVQGIDCMINAGFLPCAYIPAFKKHGRTRRDYVVLVHSLGRFPRRPTSINPTYVEFLAHYSELETGRSILVKPETP
jgi:hypothetical protein